MIEGESLLNDGTAMVLFFVILDMIKADKNENIEQPTFGEILL
jgi:NhaP-type Na+/H+ or K+/H+ antiporter